MNKYILILILIIECFNLTSSSDVTDTSTFGTLNYVNKTESLRLIKELNQIVFVSISNLCGTECSDKISYFNELKTSLKSIDLQVYAIKDHEFLQMHGISQYPKIVYYRLNRYIIYKDKIQTDNNNLFDWISDNREKATIELNDDNFEHDTQASTGMTTGDWFVLFHKLNCGTSKLIENEWEDACLKLKGQVNFAYVNTDENSQVKERFHVFDSPSLIFFRQGLMYRYTMDRINADSLISFSSGGWYKNVKAEKIPKELSKFDHILEYINRELKGNNTIFWYSLYAISGCIVLVALIFTLKCLCSKKTDSNPSHLLSRGNSRFKFE